MIPQDLPRQSYNVPCGRDLEWLARFENNGETGVPFALAGGHLPDLAAGDDRDLFMMLAFCRRTCYESREWNEDPPL